MTDFAGGDPLDADWLVGTWGLDSDEPWQPWPDVALLAGPVVFAVPAGQSVPPVEDWVDDPSLRIDVCGTQE